MLFLLPFIERAGFCNPALKTFFKNTIYYCVRIVKNQAKNEVILILKLNILLSLLLDGITFGLYTLRL